MDKNKSKACLLVATNLIAAWMERDGGDEVNVLKAAEALPAGYVPQANRLVHRGGEQEVVLRPAKVQHV